MENLAARHLPYSTTLTKKYNQAWSYATTIYTKQWNLVIKQGLREMDIIKQTVVLDEGARKATGPPAWWVVGGCASNAGQYARCQWLAPVSRKSANHPPSGVWRCDGSSENISPSKIRQWLITRKKLKYRKTTALSLPDLSQSNDFLALSIHSPGCAPSFPKSWCRHCFHCSPST